MTFEAGAVEPSPVSTGLALSRSWRSSSSRRRLQEDSSASSSTIFVANLGFNLHGRPSSAVEAGVTQIVVTSTGSGAVGSRARATMTIVPRTTPDRQKSVLGRETGGRRVGLSSVRCGESINESCDLLKAGPNPIRQRFRCL